MMNNAHKKNLVINPENYELKLDENMYIFNWFDGYQLTAFVSESLEEKSSIFFITSLLFICSNRILLGFSLLKGTQEFQLWELSCIQYNIFFLQRQKKILLEMKIRTFSTKIGLYDESANIKTDDETSFFLLLL